MLALYFFSRESENMDEGVVEVREIAVKVDFIDPILYVLDKCLIPFISNELSSHGSTFSAFLKLDDFVKSRQQALFHAVAHAFYRRSRELAITISLVMVFPSMISFPLDFVLEISTGICN
jgi:hypothetical protein